MSRRVRNAYLFVLIALTIQFVLGMATNLFVQVPTHHPGANPPEYFSGVFESVTWAIVQGPLWLLVHASFGLLLVVFGFGLLFQAFRARHRPTVVAGVVGALAILAAGFNGGSYLNYHEDFSSMLMATFFAVAVIAYAVGLWALPPPQGSPTPDA